VSINPSPTINASASPTGACSGQSVNMSLSGGSSYTILPTLGTTTNSSISFSAHGTQIYTITGASNLACTNFTYVSLTVTQTPVLPVSISTVAICDGGTATITAGAANNYSWSPGGATTSSIVVSPSVSTTYTLFQSNDNCTDTKTVTLNVNYPPTVFVSASSPSVCAAKVVTLTAAGGVSFSWSPLGGFMSSAIVSPTISTDYTVTVFDGNCTNTGTISLTVHPNPTISISASNGTICAGSQITLQASGAGSYTWNTTDTGPTLTVAPTSSTLYVVSGMSTMNTCTAQASQVISVTAVPQLTATANRTLVCSGSSSTLSASGAHTYSWSNNINTPASVVAPLSNEIYTVTGAFSVTPFCSNTQTVEVKVFTPEFSISSNTAICMGGAITLTASGASTFSWSNGPISQSNNVSPSVTTIYTASAFSASNNVTCPGSATVEVDIFSNPLVTATAERSTVCRDESVRLFAGGTADTYTWNTGTPGTATIVVTPAAQTVYSVTGTDANNCKNTATVLVRFSTCPGFEEYSAIHGLEVYPNPNNGSFTIRATQPLKLVLMNQLGQVIRTIDTGSENTSQINITGLAKGLYFINAENGRGVKRIVVE
jgi:hypothetical protein